MHAMLRPGLALDGVLMESQGLAGLRRSANGEQTDER